MSTTNFYIQDIELGSGCAPLVIPDIGINHNGDLRVAFAMVDAAARAGARLIKHQTHVLEDEMSDVAKKVIPGNADISIFEIMEQCSLSEEEERELQRYTQSKGMVYLSTPFSRLAVDRLDAMDVPAYKIGSGEMNNHPLVDYIASKGKPVIMSTGMNDLESVAKAVEILKRRGVDYALMHTTNLYPTKPHQVRLGAMQQMMQTFSDIPVGLSDHTVNNNACIAAISMGANLVERHFTDTKEREGPDIINSMDEQGLRELLTAAEEIPQMFGGEKRAIPEEQVTIDFAFATVVVTQPLKKGDRLTKENIWVMRPGTGEIKAEFYEEIMGSQVCEDVDEGEHLKWIHINKNNN